MRALVVSYGLMALSVNWTELTEFLARSDDLDAQLRGHARAFADDARDRAEDIARGAPSLEVAMRAFYTRTVPARTPHAAIYIYALKRLCEQSGSYLPNNGFYPCPLDEIARFDATMCAAGMAPALSASDTLWSAPPLGAPRTDDMPLLGRIPWSVIDAALRASPLASLPRLEGPHAQMQRDLEGWMVTCAKYYEDLVLVYH